MTSSKDKEAAGDYKEEKLGKISREKRMSMHCSVSEAGRSVKDVEKIRLVDEMY